jgi:hypothetical protein
MFKRYPQLQSGFLAPSESMVKKPEPIPTTPASSLLNRQPTRTQQDLFYVPELDDLLNTIIQRPILLRDFEFQEKILETIGKAFNGMSFASFVTLQAENPAVSQVHIDFLDETIACVLGLKENRNISVSTWSSVISAANPPHGGFKPTVMNNKYNEYKFTQMTLGVFMLLWIKRLGYSDLLLSMQTIFGRRSLHGIMGGVV